MDHVDLHAVNVYAAVLRAATGIAVPIPDVGDDLCTLGLIEFLSCDLAFGFVQVIQTHLWGANGHVHLSEIVGRSFSTFPELRSFKIPESLTSGGVGVMNKFIFAPPSTPTAMGLCATDHVTKTGESRSLKYAQYLEAFGRFLDRRVVLEKLCSQLAQERENDLKILFQLIPKAAADDDDDPRYWMWNTDDGTLIHDNAEKLLVFLRLFSE
eukprot:TRINITY_DN10745_c0_g1_i1.p2 TRINITY_DN10745_c0_g1~~TRINITY_DN10745_c0_g1_i1.p2  ORF type:complete len:230 (+),score=57.43 TRINITY_DN10745_c0_g1_i1:60-692(+)